MKSIQEIALEIACRHANCRASPGHVCSRTLRGKPLFHRVRRNDAQRILDAQAKLEDWNKRYSK
jgi:hypothetical protein